MESPNGPRMCGVLALGYLESGIFHWTYGKYWDIWVAPPFQSEAMDQSDPNGHVSWTKMTICLKKLLRVPYFQTKHYSL